MCHYVIEQLPCPAKLHDQEQFTFGLNNFIKLNDVRMSHFLKDLDLSRDSLYIFLIFDLVLL